MEKIEKKVEKKEKIGKFKDEMHNENLYEFIC